MEQTVTRRDIHREITEKIIAAIEAGAGQWQMPWHSNGGSAGRPRNAHTRQPYRGANVIVLWIAARSRGYGTDLWGTFRQWQQLGAQVRKRERATTIVFYKTIERSRRDNDEDEGPERYLLARAHPVFNADQVQGWETPPIPPAAPVVEPVVEAERFADGSRAVIRHGGGRAYYAPHSDHIQMPDRSAFVGTKTSNATESYYATLLHELVHWSGHGDRLGRDLSGRFGDEAYAMEELVAELGAAFLCADLAITNEPRPDHASYLASWLKVLRRDQRAFFTAGSRATEAAEYLASLQPAGTDAETRETQPESV